MAQFQWLCPHCGARQIVSDANCDVGSQYLYIGTPSGGPIGLWHKAIRCVNEECNRATVEVSVDYGTWGNKDFKLTTQIVRVRLLPRSNAKPQPDYIPKQIVQDYLEACLIREDSPKASATLARRALQGMIRDFCNIKGKTLFQEISVLEKSLEEDRAPRGVNEETIAAIHAIRKIGNIGAHMEGDINVIVEVDPGEAQALIDLLELLFEDWYVARHQRKAKLSRLLEIDVQKQEARNSLEQTEPQKALPATE